MNVETYLLRQLQVEVLEKWQGQSIGTNMLNNMFKYVGVGEVASSD